MKLFFSRFSMKNNIAIPDFFILGAQKSGTTALFEYLSMHPQIIPNAIKEIHFFDSERRYSEGFDFYLSQFAKKGEGQLVFDASAGYLHYPDAPKRIYKWNKSARMIALLRDPADRAYSAWNMYKKFYAMDREWYLNGWLSMHGQRNGIEVVRRSDQAIEDFYVCLQEEIDLEKKHNGKVVFEAPILSHGKYAEQLERYYSFFAKDQVLVLESDSFKRDIPGGMQEIEEFLGIGHHDWGSCGLRFVHEGGYAEPMHDNARVLLKQYYEKLNQSLYALLGRDFGWA